MMTQSTAEGTKIKVFLIDTKKREAGVKEINCDFESYEEAIHANYYTVVGIKIEDQEFTCIVDEEGLLKKNLVPSIISTDNAPTNPQTHVEIVGSCFICNTKETDDGAMETSLTSSQIKLIEKHIVRAFTVKSQQVQPLLVATVEK